MKGLNKTGGAIEASRRGLAPRLAAFAMVVVVALAGGSVPGVAGAIETSPANGTQPKSTGGADTNFKFSAEPYSSNGTQQRSYFSYQMQAGHKLLDQVVVRNLSSADESFTAYPEDATNNPTTGSFSFQARDKAHNTTVGTWLTLGQTNFTVPAGKEVVMTFQLQVPANAPPGDHVGAVVIEELHTAAQQQNPVGVNVVLRFAVPMYVRIVGPIHPALTVEDLTVFHQSPAFPYLSGAAKTAVRFNLVNTGNDILVPKSVTVSITGLISGTVHTYTVKQNGKAQGTSNPLPTQMLPGAKLQLTELWSGIPPFDPLTAHVSASATDANVSLPVTTTATSSFWYFPWILVLVILVLIAAVVARFTVWRRWRRRREELRAGGDGEPPAGPGGDGSPEPPAAPESLEEVGV